MRQSQIVSIDLGSAYTKIAIRNGWNARSKLSHGLPLALTGEEDYCVPSVVAHVESASGRRWLVGIDAANQLPGKGVQVFRNWKAALFGISVGDAFDQAVAVAVEFFREVRVKLSSHSSLDLRRLPVRVAVPRLDGLSDADPLMREVLSRAGWEAAAYRVTVFEPESNALGLLSRGRNATWVPPKQSYRPPPQRSIRMQQMLEPGLSTAFRTMSESYGVLVTDIGAFTTDFGYVRFDSSFRTDDWNRPEIVQQSVRLGIHQLDRDVLEIFGPEVQRYFETQPSSEWERRKRYLYAGVPQRIVVPNQPVTIGADFEREAIQDELRRFAGRVAAARREFCRLNGLSRVHEEAITGGGSALGTLRNAIIEGTNLTKVRMHDLWDPHEPDKAVAAGAGPMTPHQKELRVHENRTLVRAACAIGGASVFFE